MVSSLDHDRSPIFLTKWLWQESRDIYAEGMHVCSANVIIRSKLMSFGYEGAIHISWKCCQQTKTDK